MSPYLETDRLLLRPLAADDLDNLVELDADPEVMRYISGGRPSPRELLRTRILPMMLGCNERHPGLGFFAAIEKSTGAFLGWFCLRPHGEPGTDNVGLGYRLHRSVWGKGYATEGSRALVRKAFVDLGVRRVFATTYGENLASRRVMEKAGLRFVRAFRFTEDAEPVEPTYDDSPDEDEWPGEDVEYALEKDEWERLQAPAADEIAESAGV